MNKLVNVVYQLSSNSQSISRYLNNLKLHSGYGEVDGVKSALSSNVIIENKFAQQGLLCLEDVVKQIFEAGPHFELLIILTQVINQTIRRVACRTLTDPN